MRRLSSVYSTNIVFAATVSRDNSEFSDLCVFLCALWVESFHAETAKNDTENEENKEV